MSKLKVSFSKLIGRHYALDEKMEILNWMLQTGKNYDVVLGKWNVNGVGQLLLDYSANPHNYICRLPLQTEKLSWYFDAVFGRAVYQLTSNSAIKNWRTIERIFPEKSRIIQCNYDGIDNYDLIRDIERFNGKILKKDFAHPNRIDRTVPKIIDLKIYTIGSGWIVNYSFSFKEYKYESGWDFSIGQTDEETISQFFNRAISHLSSAVLTDC